MVKQRETDLKKQQEELVKSVKDVTASALDVNNARGKFEGYYYATDFLCCPDCGCLPKPKNDDANCEPGCDPRLAGCEKLICDICGKVKEVFCCPPPPDDCNGKPKAS